eukprot:scaffold39452_cov40-Attheya_sp.AAC.2
MKWCSGCWLLVAGCWLLVAGCWLLAIIQGAFYTTSASTSMSSDHTSHEYLSCLKDAKDKHHMCREMSRQYLECRMERDLMAKEDLDKMGFSADAQVSESYEYDKSRERDGWVAGKHIDKKMKWWFQRSGGYSE